MEDKAIQSVQTTIQASFGAVAGSFIMNSLHHMIVWLIVMFAVILCDLVSGVRKSWLMGEEVRITRAFRATMGKAITYFSFVVMVIMISEASGNESIARWSILFVCFLEGCSILSNILKPKGYSFDLAAAIGLLAKRVLNIDKEDTEGIIYKEKEDNKNGKCK